MAAVSGDVELMPVSDVVLWMAQKRSTGTLSVRRRSVESRFTVREGLCFQASSSDPREYFGQHLINFGYIDEDQLQRAFDTQKETHVPIGRVLVMVDAITSEQLQKVLTFKTREGFLEALCWEEGSWRLTPEVDEDRELDCERPIDLKEVWSEAQARQQMWTEIRRVFPSDATRVEVLVDAARVDSGFDRRLLQLMGAGKTVGEAALELRAMDFQTYARLYDLQTRHVVRPRVTTSTVELPTTMPKTPTASSLLSPMPSPPPTVRAPSPQPPAQASTVLATMPLQTIARPAPAPTVAVDVNLGDIGVVDEPTEAFEVDVETGPVPRAPTTPPPVATTSTAAPTPTREGSRSFKPLPRSSTPMGNFFGAGSYMMVKPEKAEEAPGVKIPPEAEDPEKALRLALAGRDWSAALLISQRILERDPLNSEALAAYRVAEAQLRRREKESPQGEPDFNRIPAMAMARDEVALTHLTSKERYVLSRVDGRRTLQQIAAVSPITRQELVRIVDAFVQKGVLTL